MRKFSLIFLMSFLSIQPAFADDSMMMSSDSRPCMSIAKACKKAGYSRKENEGKKFWVDCMKPILQGHKVKNVQIDSATVKSCRTDKIDRLKQEIKDLQNATDENY